MTVRTAGKPLCACCGGARRVLSATGELRPCTICAPKAEIDAWFAARRPRPQPTVAWSVDQDPASFSPQGLK